MKNLPLKKPDITHFRPDDNAVAETVGAAEKAGDQILGRFADVAMIAAGWFFELDAELRISFLSCDLHLPSGRQSSELIGTGELEFCKIWSDNSESLLRYLELIKAHKPFDMEIELIDEQGRSFYMHSTGKVILSGDNVFMGYRGCSRDVTEARHAVLAFEQSKNRFRDIIENVTDIIATVDEKGDYNYYNDSVERILGYSLGEIRNMAVGDVAIAEDRKLIIDAHREAMDNPARVVKVTYRCRHKDGSFRVLESTRQQLHQPGNQGRELVIHARDITDQYFAEKSLQESEQRLRDYAETAADWFWEQDKDLRFTDFSGNLPDFFSEVESNLMGRTRQECTPELAIESPQWSKLSNLLDARLPFSNFEYQISPPGRKPSIVRISGKPVFDEHGEFTGYRGTGIDITESHLLSQQLSYHASHDSLTGLVNRREFELRLSRVIVESQKNNSDHALCYIDLDQFKVVNDTCGHDAGDELLRQISSLLKEKVRNRDTIARLGGDEFGLLLERCTLNQANRVAEAVRRTIAEFRFIWAGRSFKLGASVGLIPINSGSGNFNEVMRSADAACYAAKDAGRNQIHVYHAENFEVAERHAEMQRIVDINRAFDDQRFVLYQQTIQSLQPGADDCGPFCELLVRMLDEQGQPVLPGEFLPTAERYNLVTQLDTWVVNASFKWLTSMDNLRCSINLSAMSIVNDEFLQFILATLDASKVDPGRICFEITETAAIANLSKATCFINRLRDRGIYFALDDFGSGLSSFAYLKTLPVDFLKIDGFFVRDMVDDRINFEMVKSINDIGHVMGKQTIAEFVETDEVMAALKDIGVDYAQGYGIAMPEPIELFS